MAVTIPMTGVALAAIARDMDKGMLTNATVNAAFQLNWTLDKNVPIFFAKKITNISVRLVSCLEMLNSGLKWLN